MKYLASPHTRHLGMPTGTGRGQRGAITILSALVVFLVLTFVGISIDTGRLWMERRNIQRMADMAAMTSTHFTGCGGSLNAVRQAALRSVLANGVDQTSIDNGTASVTVTHGTLTRNATNEWLYTPVDNDRDSVRAAQVTVSKKVAKSLILGGWLASSDRYMMLSATATARGGPPIATYSMDASMLTIDTPFTRGMNALLESVFTRPPNLGAPVYSQLAASSVSLEELRQAGGFGSIEEMLNSDKTVAWLLQTYSMAAASSDAKNGTAGAAALSQLINAIGPSNLHLQLKDVLKLNPGDKEALLDARINLLELVKVSVTVGAKNSGRVFDVPVDVGGVKFQMQFNDVPQIAVGPGGKSAETGQWCTASKSADTVLSFSIGNGPFQHLLALFTFGAAKADIKFKLMFGNANARLNYIDPTVGAAKVQYSVNTSPLTMSITNNAEDADGFIGVQIGKSKFGVSLGNYGNSIKENEANVLVPKYPEAMPTPVQRKLIPGSSEMQGTLAGILNSIPVPTPEIGDIPLFSALVKGIMKLILQPVMDVVMGIVGTLLANTIDPLLRAIGIHFGSADVMLFDLRTVPPELVSVKTVKP